MKRILLVLACGDIKTLDPITPALDRYAGRQFNLARAALKDGLVERVMILSAEHGLIPDWKPVEKYDRRMSKARAAELINDRTGLLDFQRACDAEDIDEVVFYGGEEYFRVIDYWASECHLGSCDGSAAAFTHIVGAGCGDHFSVLKQVIEEQKPKLAA